MIGFDGHRTWSSARPERWTGRAIATEPSRWTATRPHKSGQAWLSSRMRATTARKADLTRS